MEATNNKEKYEIKYDEMLDGDEKNNLSFLDILWLDNLAYFRDLAVKYEGKDLGKDDVADTGSGGNICTTFASGVISKAEWQEKNDNLQLYENEYDSQMVREKQESNALRLNYIVGENTFNSIANGLKCKSNSRKRE